MSGYRKIIEKAMAPDDFDMAAAKKLPCIRMASNRTAYIDGHRGILQYEKDKIVVAAKNADITLEGQDLLLSSFTSDHIKIKGRIFSVTLKEHK